MEWISAKEGLPIPSAEPKYVLVCARFNAVGVGHYVLNENMWAYTLLGGIPQYNNYVTHWMPLPKPPTDCKDKYLIASEVLAEFFQQRSGIGGIRKFEAWCEDYNNIRTNGLI